MFVSYRMAPFGAQKLMSEPKGAFQREKRVLRAVAFSLQTSRQRGRVAGVPASPPAFTRTVFPDSSGRVAAIDCGVDMEEST